MNDTSLPLTALLSQALTAFTIEADNEFERQMPRQSADGGSWAASLVMWYNCMQFVEEQGIPMGRLYALARTSPALHGLARWGYITVTPPPTESSVSPKPSQFLVRATQIGHTAQEVWRHLAERIEDRWQERFGAQEVARLRDLLAAHLRPCERPLPDCLPNMRTGLRIAEPNTQTAESALVSRVTERPLSLPVLLARSLLVIALEFEPGSRFSLAVGANILRILTAEGVPISNLPALSGVSQQAIRAGLTVLQQETLASVEAQEEDGKKKIARLTTEGLNTQRAFWDRLQVLEQGWRKRAGEDNLTRLRQALTAIVRPDLGPKSLLFYGLTPYADGWRATFPAPRVLPHFPIVLLHRGGYPDGR